MEDKTNYEELTKFNLKSVKNVMLNFEDRLCDEMQERVNQIEKFIENLIARNKELESALDNSVSKDEIKAKIEERKNNISYLSKFNDWNNKEYTNEDITNYCIEILQELLNKGE